jgi:glyoxylase-like metal-dependent hydrolase (beta-lactamase superfamily II)
MSQGSPSAHNLDRETVDDRVVRVALPLPLPDLKVVNAYVIAGSDGVTLIDPGWAWPQSEALLRTALNGLGAEPADVRQILVTHQHWDHYSQGVRWRDEFGAELMLGREERHSIEAFTPLGWIHPVQVGLLQRAGAPVLARAIEQLDWQPYERDVKLAPPDRWLDDGDEIDCEATTILVRATPGHTRGHVVFDDVAHGIVFTGDHLLPRITPSIAFERAPERLPLQSYMSSLQLFLQLPDARMLPAHGATDRSTRGRAGELLVHHGDRLNQVAELVAAGWVTAYEVALQMRWTRRERDLGELDLMNQMTAVLEVLSHLDLLVAQRLLVTHDEDDRAVFATA